MKRFDVLQFNKAFTHGGVFHADDVFSTALIKLLNPDIEIIRGFQIPEDFHGIVYDIGGGQFDHHQTEKELRASGTPYAAFGLLWRSYGHMLVEDEEVADFDKLFVEPLDLADNTGVFNAVANIISKLNPSWEEDSASDDAFDRAVDMAMVILDNYVKDYGAKRKARVEVEKHISDSKILVLPKYVPWKTAVCHRDIYYVVFPSARGGYNVQAVPVSVDDATLKKGFPQAWRGCMNQELREKTKVKTAVFCHSSGFLCVAETQTDAIRLAELSIEALI
ncbi:MAG: MYG1 family protein [Lachnospiraceae bacterium]|nr:MYG1 family protein [Lachnospiraceae bacterium]